MVKVPFRCPQTALRYLQCMIFSNIMIHQYRQLFVKMKVFIYSELHFFEVTSYKIPTFVSTCHMMLSQSKIANTCSFCRIYKIYIFTKPAFIVIETFYKKKITLIKIVLYQVGFVIFLGIVPLSDNFTQNILSSDY